MLLGTFTKTETNGFHGSIRTLTLALDLAFEPNREKKGDKAPDYRVSAGDVEIGAAWKKESEAGNAYLSVTLDDPAFSRTRHPPSSDRPSGTAVHAVPAPSYIATQSINFRHGDFMGMDVFGLNPTNETGAYFRNNVWWWHPLAEYITGNCPEEITGGCADWHSNSGCGLDGKDAVALADILDAQLADGTTAAYVRRFDTDIASVPDETCHLCHGTGIRQDVDWQRDRVVAEPGHPRDGQRGWCNGCEGRGSRRPISAWYRLDTDNIAEFSAFLRHCGGFAIR